MTGVGGRSDTKNRLILERISMKNKNFGVCGRSRGQAQSWHVDLRRGWKLQGRLVILFLHLTIFVRSWHVCFRREWRLEGRLVILFIWPDYKLSGYQAINNAFVLVCVLSDVCRSTTHFSIVHLVCDPNRLYSVTSRFHICFNSRYRNPCFFDCPDCLTRFLDTILNFLQQKEGESALRLELIRSFCAKIKDCTTSNFSFPSEPLLVSELVSI